MDTYIARQPILNRDNKVEAYELIYYQGGRTYYNQNDSRVANTIMSFFNQVDGSGFLSNKDCFLTFTPNLLMQNIPRVFDEKKLVIQFEDNVLVNPAAKIILDRYKKQGYRLAFSGFDFNNRHLDILPNVDIIKLDFAKFDSDETGKIISIGKKLGKKLAAFNVDTDEAREAAKAYDLDYIQGQAIAKLESSKIKKIDHLQSTFFRLMVAVTKEEPDFDEIASLISLDVSLTFSLIKMVNSAYFSIPNRIKDVKQALTVIGLGQLKQWIYLLGFVPNGGMTDELIKTSFLRAVFCQELSKYIKSFDATESEAYLLGMFSTLDALLGVSLEDAVRELPIAETIKNGLTKREGPCGELLNMCIFYENGEWSKAERCAVANDIPVSVIAQTYVNAVKYVNETMEELMKPFVEQG